MSTFSMELALFVEVPIVLIFLLVFLTPGEGAFDFAALVKVSVVGVLLVFLGADAVELVVVEVTLKVEMA